jgi:hypothetical protein
MRLRLTTAVLAAALVVLALTLAWSDAASSARASQTGSYMVTMFGWPDNLPPGDQIAYPAGEGYATIHNSAGGRGTYSDPVTFATDEHELPAGTRIYVPYLRRYFLMEDDCAVCDKDWAGQGPDGGPHLPHIAVWVGGQGAHSADVLRCEARLARDAATVIVDPPAGEPVTTTPLFDASVNACYRPGSGRSRPASAATPSPSPTVTSAPTHTAAPRQASSSPPSAPHPLTFSATAGYGCQSTTDAWFTEHGQWTQGLNGYIQVRSGGPPEPGCTGAYDAMPMSGSATEDDPGNYALWIFRTAPVSSGRCHIRVYVPSASSRELVGGHPAVYEVYNSAGLSGARLGSFTVDQLARRGQWVGARTWPVTNGLLTVKVDSRGVDWNSHGPDHAHIAISAVSVSCAA